jgi:hypothetical protein
MVIFVIAVAARFLSPEESRTEEQEKALFYQSDFVSVPDGSLIRAEGDDRVYYAADGHKRWIDSAATFAAQGFRAEDIIQLSREAMVRYPDGEPITGLSKVILSREQKVLPDLAPLAPYQLRLSTVNGRTVIRFTGSFWNKGYRPFELTTENHVVGDGAQSGSEDVYQNVQAEDGTVRKKFVGTFVWHSAHNHHHYADFAEYLFESALMNPGAKTARISTRQKTTFCIRDDERMPADIPNVSFTPVFTTCGKERQAVSPGWIDVYPSTLPDQYVDVHDAPPGVYALSFLLDPTGRFVEERGDNNIGTTLVELNVQRGILRTLATLSPFSTTRNHIEDGTLLRDVESGNVYVIQNNQKRWLQSVDIFLSYGYAWNNVYPVTKAMLEAIPSQKLIRLQSTQEVLVVNERGYYRHLLSPEVFASYGFRAEDVADITDFDFASYVRGDLITYPGDAQVYLIEGTTKRPIGTLVELQVVGRDLRGLHVVNRVDFDAYTTVARSGAY